ncbi:hypothetical protein HH219_13580 [Pseudoalteromonas sp. NEC-BIFX-2020_015]|uniref:hypothetical protein n=1 Tax=Pseudoalteromonas sp. NEC-BIFX-2020_015 TaxID=2729544 RepID=UPI0014616EFE|nr:hypothetical protein [Pseudoalteromonas sp. NEC-BIFX-2020_015]NMR26552.1 hypothetical protein [Pseudoalteromonas sp. NEC-BIFX-2020_015]
MNKWIFLIILGFSSQVNATTHTECKLLKKERTSIYQQLNQSALLVNVQQLKKRHAILTASLSQHCNKTTPSNARMTLPLVGSVNTYEKKQTTLQEAFHLLPSSCDSATLIRNAHWCDTQKKPLSTAKVSTMIKQIEIESDDHIFNISHSFESATITTISPSKVKQLSQNNLFHNAIIVVAGLFFLSVAILLGLCWRQTRSNNNTYFIFRP